jgi:hypothetical protein
MCLEPSTVISQRRKKVPNWVLNKVNFYGKPERLKQLREFITTSETSFNFEKLLPVPEPLKISSGSDEHVALRFASVRRKYKDNWKDSTEFKQLESEYEKVPWVKTERTWDEWADLGDVYLANVEMYGATTWYDWCIDNWGTKWNACDIDWEDDAHVKFETAWSAPEGIYKALAEAFPDVHFEVEFADEDIGNNCGCINYFGEDVQIECMNDYDFACGVWGYDPEEEEAWIVT